MEFSDRNWISFYTPHHKDHINYKLYIILCRSCRDGDEASNYIISGYGKQAQKGYKNGYDCVGKMIH